VVVKTISRPQLIAQRIAAFLEKHHGGYCENCLVERLLIASRAAMKAALEMEIFSHRVGVCPDCKMRKQIVSYRSKTNVAA
jgi:hypothetical protein